MSHIATDRDGACYDENFSSASMDEVDVIMSQIITEGTMSETAAESHDAHGDFVKNICREGMDEIDVIMSQMITEGDVVEYVEKTNGGNGSIEKTVGSKDEIPPHLMAEYEKAVEAVIPAKSGKRYLNAYNVFVKWQETNNTTSFDEKVLLAYFCTAGDKYKPSTLWSMYSMLKSTIMWKQSIDISRYCQLNAWLKRKNDGYECKQSNVFSAEEISRFVLEAPNNTYLGIKVVLAFGIMGLSRGSELTNLKCSNIRDTGEDFVVKIPTTKTKTPKMYVVDGQFNHIIRQYVALRPPDATTDRFFMQYRNGRCINQVIGKNNIAKFPKEIAKFLQLNDPESYTGHSYRRSGTTIAADAGATIDQLKRMGPWKSTTVCEKYIQESLNYKRKLGKIISGAIDLPSTATTGSVEDEISTNNVRPMMCGNASSGATSSATFCAPSDAMSSARSGGVSGSVSEAVNSVNSVFCDMRKITQVIAQGVNLSTERRTSEEIASANSVVLSQERNSGNSFGINVPNKNSVVFHFGSECSNFTIINYK